jgi:phenylpyruvate tautomerase PptA (4-oxalocrotonate tautomerase family)
MPSGAIMPHLTVHALDHQLDGHEQTLAAALTEAVVAVYGEWAREIAVVQLVGLPAGRWTVGGEAPDTVAPAVTFGIRAGALTRPDTPDILRRLATGVTDAIAGTLGEDLRAGTVVEFVGQPDEFTAVGGHLVTETPTA